MADDRIVLFENMDFDEATKLVKSLPAYTSKNNRHKFVFTESKELIIGRADIGNPRHKELGDPKQDIVAGYICFVFDDEGEIIEVYMNNQSEDFNHPPFENLKEPQILITKLFGPISIDMEDIPKPVFTKINLPDSAAH